MEAEELVEGTDNPDSSMPLRFSGSTLVVGPCRNNQQAEEAGLVYSYELAKLSLQIKFLLSQHFERVQESGSITRPE
jgi:hypothetical protein